MCGNRPGAPAWFRGGNGKTRAATYDGYQELLRSQLVKEWESEIGRVKRTIAKETEAARLAKTTKDRQHYERSVQEREKRLAELEKNDPLYIDPEALKK
jgi:hypothetical protein